MVCPCTLAVAQSRHFAICCYPLSIFVTYKQSNEEYKLWSEIAEVHMLIVSFLCFSLLLCKMHINTTVLLGKLHLNTAYKAQCLAHR